MKVRSHTLTHTPDRHLGGGGGGGKRTGIATKGGLSKVKWEPMGALSVNWVAMTTQAPPPP